MVLSLIIISALDSGLIWEIRHLVSGIRHPEEKGGAGSGIRHPEEKGSVESNNPIIVKQIMQ